MTNDGKHTNFAVVLPVLFYEYLSISLTKSLVPSMIVAAFGQYAYFAVGITETVKGIIAFLSCPLWGRFSDQIGRKTCLLFTVIGSTAPVCVLAFTTNMYIYSFVLALSGFFSGTFPLTFAYISDCVTDKKKRAPAYGLALATFGLSFCIGPLAGSYIATTIGPSAVFICSLILVFMDIIYIVTSLPETVRSASVMTNPPTIQQFRDNLIPNTWDMRETFRIFRYVYIYSHHFRGNMHAYANNTLHIPLATIHL